MIADKPRTYGPCPTCPTCGGAFVQNVSSEETCVGYFSPSGHDHDENCRIRLYRCASDHLTALAIVRRCPVPGCSWRGPTSCFCCERFVDEWPPVAVAEGERARAPTAAAPDCVMAAQPPPVPNDRPAVWDLVIADMHERDRVGRERYGTPLQAHNGRDALVDAYQEAMDLAVYLRQRIEEDRAAAAELRAARERIAALEADLSVALATLDAVQLSIDHAETYTTGESPNGAPYRNRLVPASSLAEILSGRMQ